MTKTCFKCKREQPRSAFYRHPMMGDGLLGKCRDCTKADVKANYYAHREQYQRYERERQQRLERRKKKQAYCAKANRRYPEKAKARRAVSYAVRTGKLKRQPCGVCGERAEAHHENYSRPLEITWLCLKHHRDRHRELAS